MKPQHTLKPSIKEFDERHCIIFDTETHTVFNNEMCEFYHQLWFMCYQYTVIDNLGEIHTHYTRYCEDNETLWNDTIDCLFNTPTRILYLIAHNQQFDLGIINISTFVQTYNAIPKKVVLEYGKVIVDLMIPHEGKNYWLKIRDTMNYYPTSLEAIGRMIGTYKYDFPTEKDGLGKWVEYCIEDVNITAKFYAYFVQFVLKNNFGNVAETLASQAFITFKNRFMKHDILVHDRERVMHLERASYHGGRVECFYIGKYNEHVYKLDINSMYPYVMFQNTYPTKLINNETNVSVERLHELFVQGYKLIADVIISLDENSTGIMHENNYIFPIGKNIHAYLSTPEILLNLDKIVKVNQVAYYEHENIFTDYVTWFYNKRMEYKEDKTQSDFYKLMLNSLYGKFGQRDSLWIDIDDMELPFNSMENVCIVKPNHQPINYLFRNVLGKVQLKNNNLGNSIDACVSIASHVTAYARCYLYKMMKLAGNRNVIYVDTDCLFVNETGYDNLQSYINPSQLGMLKNEGIYEYAVIYGNKDYELYDGTTLFKKLKGVRKKAEYLGKDEHGKDHYKQFKMSKWVVSAMRGNGDKIIHTDVIKHLSREYSKGMVCDDGWVSPHILMLAYSP